MLYRRIFPREYLRLCPDERERARIIRAEALVDFVELGRHGGGLCSNPADISGLYAHLTPNRDERIPYERIEEGISLHDQAEWHKIKQCGYGARFHALAALMEGRVVGISFFKSLRMDCKGYFTGLMYAGTADREFAFSRYGIDDDFRGRGIAKALLLLSQGITLEDAEMDGRRAVMGAFCDSVLRGPAGSGARAHAAGTGLETLSGLGLLPVMFDTGGGRWMAPAVQPALTAQAMPLVMHLLFRPFGTDIMPEDGIFPIERVLAAKLVSAYIRSYDAMEGDRQAIGFARDSMLARFDMARRVVLMHPGAVPDISALAEADPLLRAQIERSPNRPLD
ncbi:hypothetical protein L0Y65_07075 [Candidatus Micrarchaeota archaeon]|nr:hypothetical protein [Candidatus Micrarchaeota archaeon]